MEASRLPDFRFCEGVMLAWLNGEFVEEDSILLSIRSHALHYATSVFEGVRAYHGKVFAAMPHAERLIYSAKTAGVPCPYDPQTIVSAKEELLKKTGLRNAYIRPVVWKGGDSLGIYAPKNPIHTAIIMFDWPSVFESDSISLTTKVPYRRPNPEYAPVQAKAASHYLLGVLNREEAERQKYNDALLADYKGHVAEASGANIFLEKDGTLFTPVPKNFLNGITRQVVIALAKEHGIPVQEMDISFDSLGAFEHVFLTGTAYEVMPVNKIDGHAYAVGGFTTILQAAYNDLTSSGTPIVCRDGKAEIVRK